MRASLTQRCTPCCVGALLLLLHTLLLLPSALSGLPDGCQRTLIEDLPPPINKPPTLSQKSPLKFAFVAFTPKGTPVLKADGYPADVGVRMPIMLGERLSTYLAEPPVFYSHCSFDLGGYDIIITRGCKCVSHIRKMNPEAIIGVTKGAELIAGEGVPARHDKCERKLDFVIADSGAMQQRLTAAGIPSIHLKAVETVPVDDHTGAALKAPVLEKFDSENPARVCFHGDYQDFDTLRRKLLDRITKRRFSVPFEVDLFFGKSERSAAMKAMPKPSFKVRIIQPTGPTGLFTSMQNCTVGIVSSIFRDQDDEEREKCAGDNCQNQDLQWRYQLDSNAAKAYVFAQMGIPVVADAVPEVAEVIGANKLGISLEDPRPVAWAWAVKTLLNDHCMRSFYAERSRAYAAANLSPGLEAQRLLLYATKLRKAIGRGSAGTARPDALTGTASITFYEEEARKASVENADGLDEGDADVTEAAVEDGQAAVPVKEIQPFGKAKEPTTRLKPGVSKEESKLPDAARMPKEGAGERVDDDPDFTLDSR